MAADIEPSTLLPARVHGQILVIAPEGPDESRLVEIAAQQQWSVLHLHEVLAQPASVCESWLAVLMTGAGLGLPGVDWLLACLEDQPLWSDLPLLFLGPRPAPDSPHAARFHRLEASATPIHLSDPLDSASLAKALQTASRTRLRQYAVRDRLAELETHVPDKPQEQRTPAKYFMDTEVATLLDRISDVYFAVDRAWRFTYFNRRAEEILQVPAHSVLGQVLWDAFPQLRGTIYETHYRAAMETQQPQHFESSATAAARWYATSVYPSPGGLSVLGRDVTEQRRLTAQLQRERSRLEAVLQHMPVGVIMAEAPSGRMLLSNSQVEQIWRRSFPLAASWEEYSRYAGFHTDGRTLAPEECPLTRALTRGEVVRREEIDILRGDGTQGTLAVSAAPIRDEAGQILAGVAVFDDITAAKQLADDLRWSEERYRRVSESGFLALAFFRIDGAVTEANDAFLKLVGYTRQELLDGLLRWDRLTPPEWLPVTYDAVEELKATGKIEPYEKEYARKDGSRFWGLFGGAQLGKADEWVGFIVDVTAQKQAEQLIQTSEARFRHLADAMPQLVWIADGAGVVTYYNERRRAYAGFATRVDGSWEWAPVLHPDDLAKTEAAWAQALAAGVLYQCEHRVRMANGDYRWHLSRGRPIRNEHGEVVTWYGTATDIHAQKLAEQKLLQLNEELEERVVERTERLRQLNLELQQEIANREAAQAEVVELRGHLEEGREAERLRLAQDLHDLPMQELYAAQYALTALINDLGDEALQQRTRDVEEMIANAAQLLREISHELRPPALTGFGLVAAIRSHVHQFCHRYPSPQIELHLEEMTGELSMAAQLVFFRIYQQAMHNVIRHARAQQVWVRLRHELDEVILRVEDDGCGFVVPERWVELAREQHFGLVGSAERADAIGAIYTVRSSPGMGTTVEVRLAVAAGDGAAQTRSEP